MYFFTDEKNRSFCRRYNREVNFKRDVEDIGLCDKCGMRDFELTGQLRYAYLHLLKLTCHTIDTRDEGKKSKKSFGDKDFAEKGSDFESKSWQ